MKKILSIIGGIVVLLFLITGLSNCSSQPSYSIRSIEYDPVAKVLSWSDNSDAEKWIVHINGKKHKVSEPEYSFDAQDQDFTFSIEGLHKKAGNDINPTASGTMKFLAQAQNLRIENGMLCWDAVPGATAYEVYNFNNPLAEVTIASCEVPSGSFSFTVKPINYDYSYTYEPNPITGTILVAPTNLQYKEGFVTWNYSESCDYFQAIIDGKEFQTKEKQIAFDGNGKTFTISVQACATGTNSYSSQFITETCYYLSPITEYSFDEKGNLVWPAVENAALYAIDLNGSAKIAREPLLGDLELDTEYKVKIRPQAEEGTLYYTGTVTEYVFEKLSPVDGIRFDAQTNTITWNKHSRAISYDLIVNGEQYNPTDPKQTIGRTEANLSIQVYAKGKLNNSRSYFAEEVNYTFLGNLGSPTIANGKLVWNASDKAVKYRVTFADQTYKETDKAELTDFTKGVQHTVTVTSYGENEYCFSYPSAQFTFMVLNSPSPRFSSNSVIWDYNTSAAGYRVEVAKDGVVINTVDVGQDAALSYPVTGLVDAGRYAIRVKATASSNLIYDSEYSTAFEVVRLGVSTGHTILNDTNRTDYLEIALNEVNDAQGYTIQVNNTQNFAQSQNATLKLDLLGPSSSDLAQDFTIRVKALGAGGNNSPVYLDSLQEYVFTVKKLATPSNVRVENKMVRWDSVVNATGYIVAVGGNRYTANTTEYELTNVGTGYTDITVYAVNNSPDTVNSRASTKKTVQKLPPVNNVHLTKSGEQLLLQWDDVPGSSAYFINIGGTIINRDVPGYNLAASLQELITAGVSKDIVVHAKGDGAYVLDSEPSQTITLARFNQPATPTISGTNLSWSECRINNIAATSYQLVITPVGGGSPIIQTPGGTSFSTDSLAPGQYRVKVMAFGDNQKTLDSGYSGELLFTKLAAVDVSSIQGEAGTTRLKWNHVSGAEYYWVTVNGSQARQVYDPVIDLKDLVTTRQAYTIKITARSGSNAVIDSAEISYSLTVQKVSKPTYSETSGTAGTFTIEQPGGITGTTFTVSITAPTENIPSGNVQYLFRCGNDTTSATPFFQKTMDLPGYEYRVFVQYVVQCFGTDGVFYLSSDLSDVKIVTYQA